MSATKKIILCADDYGQNLPVTEGIISLIEKNRLSATSCLTTFPAWNKLAKLLIPFQKKIDIGLHFNLTENNAPFKSLIPLLIRSQFRFINPKIIQKQLRKQLDAFAMEMGKLPDFIDGHQHVHHLPIVREALLKVYTEYFPSHNCYLRICVSKEALSASGFLKAAVISLTGAWALKKQVKENNIPHNSSFAGIYNFADSKNYSTYFQHFLRHIHDRGLIMCHPGLKQDNQKDPLYQSRWQEYQYLASNQFMEDCAKYNVMISRFC